MDRTTFCMLALTASLALLSGCGAHASKSAHPADVLRDAISPVAAGPPQGVLAPAKYVPPPAPAAQPAPAAPPAPASKSAPAAQSAPTARPARAASAIPMPGADSVVVDTTGLPRLDGTVNVDRPPGPIVRVAPQYPAAARNAHVEGTVVVQALVGTDGTVLDVRVMKSIAMLDDAAKAAVRQWKFTPGLWEGKPVAIWIGVPVKFTLH